MDYNKLIERLYQHDKDYGEGRTQDFFRVCLDCKDAATALSTLQAENEKLRADLEQVKAERDAAVKDMEALMWFSGEGCHICAHEIIIHKEPYVRSECALGNCAACCPTWRGPQKED